MTSSRTQGNHGGRPKAIDDNMVIYARALRDAGQSVPVIAKKLVIKTGKNAGTHPLRRLALPPSRRPTKPISQGPPRGHPAWLKIN